MKKIVLTLILSLAFSLPVLAEEQDWKETIMDEFVALADSIADTITAETPQDNSPENPNTKFKQIIQKQFNANIWHAIYGFCSSNSAISSIPTPESIVQESAKIHNKILRGSIPSSQAVRSFGINCLSHVENQMASQGISKEQIQSQMATLLRLIIQQNRKSLGQQ